MDGLKKDVNELRCVEQKLSRQLELIQKPLAELGSDPVPNACVEVSGGSGSNSSAMINTMASTTSTGNNASSSGEETGTAETKRRSLILSGATSQGIAAACSICTKKSKF